MPGAPGIDNCARVSSQSALPGAGLGEQPRSGHSEPDPLQLCDSALHMLTAFLQ